MEDMRRKDQMFGNQFLALLNLPRCEFNATREHRLHFWEITEAQIHMLMDLELVRDAYTKVKPKNLVYDDDPQV